MRGGSRTAHWCLDIFSIQDKRVPIAVGNNRGRGSVSESESKDKRWDLDTRTWMCTVHRSSTSAGPIVAMLTKLG
jgi:hypothetical protein